MSVLTAPDEGETMTRWELDPERVRGVLHQVEGKRTELEDALAET